MKWQSCIREQSNDPTKEKETVEQNVGNVSFSFSAFGAHQALLHDK